MKQNVQPVDNGRCGNLPLCFGSAAVVQFLQSLSLTLYPPPFVYDYDYYCDYYLGYVWQAAAPLLLAPHQIHTSRAPGLRNERTETLPACFQLIINRESSRKQNDAERIDSISLFFLFFFFFFFSIAKIQFDIFSRPATRTSLLSLSLSLSIFIINQPIGNTRR